MLPTPPWLGCLSHPQVSGCLGSKVPGSFHFGWKIIGLLSFYLYYFLKGTTQTFYHIICLAGKSVFQVPPEIAVFPPRFDMALVINSPRVNHSPWSFNCTLPPFLSFLDIFASAVGAGKLLGIPRSPLSWGIPEGSVQ